MHTLERIDVKGLDQEDLKVFFAKMGEKAFRVKQLVSWIYARGATDFDHMTDISKVLRQKLAERLDISEWEPELVQTSRDGTEKYLFRLEDGQSIEAVRIPMDEGRSTLCISTQVGCAMQCSFCLTGTFGLIRNLSTSEIVHQVTASLTRGPVTNIVMMGMGEPLHNLDNVVKAIHILSNSDGLKFSKRRITLSTSGLVPEMLELGRRVEVNLAVSLNATTDEVRDMLMPVNRRYPLKELMAACRAFPLRPHRRITFEYILIGGVNDSLEDARRLVKLLHGVKGKVNLIPFNEHTGSSFRSPAPAQMDAFQTYLLDRDIVATRRASKGQDISAACGQLKGLSDASTKLLPAS